MELFRQTKQDVDMSAEVEILAYTYEGSAPIEVVARAQLGDSAQPLSGTSGTFVLNFYINDIFIAPASQISVSNKTQAIVVSRAIPVESGDEISVRVTGTADDTAITTTATLRDVTPAKLSEMSGLGSVVVDHHYGGKDALTVVTAAGAKVGQATIRVYLADDYDNNRRERNYVIASVRTLSNGRWDAPVLLDPGTYVLLVFKPGHIRPKTHRLVVA